MANEHRLIRWLFPITILLSAFLLFFVQPLASKELLPHFGGTHAVWNSSLFFYTTLLLLGYLYAHGLVMLQHARREGVLHTLLIIAAAVSVLGFLITPAVEDLTDTPIRQLLFQLIVRVGLPFFILATTSPLLQSWYGRLGEKNPYPLYVVSNVGSIAGVVGYPLIELFLPLSINKWLWAGSFGMYLLLLFAALYLYARHTQPAVEKEAAVPDARIDLSKSVPWATQLRWLGLAFLPAMMLPAVTTYSFKGMAAAPLFWMIPLLLYLLSFIIAFRAKPWHPALHTVLKIALAAALLAIPLAQSIHKGEFFLHILFWGPFTLFVTALLCHRTLYESRPNKSHLTLFYLILSLGGALGNLFVGILAPVIFSYYHEFYLGLGLAGFLLIQSTLPKSDKRHLTYFRHLIAVTVVLVFVGMGSNINKNSANSRVLSQVRGFYGSIRVDERPFALPNDSDTLIPARLVISDHIVHGGQYLDPDYATLPLAYYTTDQGIELVLRSFRAGHDRPLRFGSAGLGAGALAGYCENRDHFLFYEISPLMAQVASEYFTYLENCPGAEVVMGDARLSIAREVEGESEGERQALFDIFLQDAFSDNAVPIHLLTLEALDLYLERTAEDGIIVYHISNRYLDLQPMIRALAQARGLEVHFVKSDKSSWALLPRDDKWLEYPPLREAITEIERPDRHPSPWRDDFYSILWAW